MPDQYQNFTNPTIIPDKPMGWQAANQQTAGAVGAFGDLIKQKYQAQEGMKQDIAKSLLSAKINRLLYPQFGNPQADSQIDAMISQNPYARNMLQGVHSSLGQQGQPQQDNAMPMAGGMNGGQPGANAGPSGAGQGGSMSMFNPASSGPVVTSQNQELKTPFGNISQTTQNPAGEAIVSGAKEYAGKMSGEMAGATAGVAKDTQQLGMITNAMKPLVQNYEDVYNSKAAGLPAAGDIYGSNIVKHLDIVPRGMQKNIVNPQTQKAAGQFLANKNELVTKLQPLLSQQFGKDGSVRIMDSLIKMSQQEIGDLSTPRDQFHGQISGTISSLYRIAKAAQAYKQDLQTSGATPPDPEVAAHEIAQRMQMQAQSPQEQQELQKLIDDTLGRNPSAQGGSMNPVMNQQPTQQGQNVMTATNPQTGQKIKSMDGGQTWQ